MGFYRPEQEMISEMSKALLAVYRKHGPRGGLRGELVPIEKFAAMSRAEVNRLWDFSDRHLMHRIAKAIR